MARNIEACDLSHAWVGAMAYLETTSGKAVNVSVTFAHCEAENATIRALVDQFLAERNIPPINEVANTIFAQGLYFPSLGNEAQRHLYTEYLEAYDGVVHRYRGNGHGTYFQRLISWRSGDQTINQLESLIGKLKHELHRQGPPGPKSSMYELAVSEVATANEVAEHEAEDVFAADLRVFDPARDRKQQMGFPCLSHISLTYTERRLHMTALYRNQAFITKAYGNFLGLAQLLRFICLEVGCDPGEITCMASHADAEFAEGKDRIAALVQACRFLTAGGEA